MMNTFFGNFVVVSRPPSSQKLTDFHWECFEAIRSGKLQAFLNGVAGNYYKQILASKTLIELESLGLIANQSEMLSYDEWSQSTEIEQPQVEVQFPGVGLAGDSMVPNQENSTDSGDDEEISSSQEFIEVKERVISQKVEQISIEL